MKRMISALLLTILVLHAAEPADQALVLNEKRVRLGTKATPEWEWFESDPPVARRLDLRFNAWSSAQEATLFIRQDDVRQDWSVELNGKPLGRLFPMEQDLVHHLAIPSGELREGANTLTILPPKENDDIVIHEIWIDPRPAFEAVAEGILSCAATDDRRPLPCRVTIVDSHGSLAPLWGLTNGEPHLAVRPGVVYTGSGQARVGLPVGDYTVYASRGFEWSVVTQQVHIAKGQTAHLNFALRREVPTPGLVSCDTHIHTFTHSGHGDATMDERVLTLAGEGIELPVATDHNRHTDYSEIARHLGVAEYFTPVIGNEVTTPAGHFNIFPVQAEARVPDFTPTDWSRLMPALRATPGVRVVVLNHPRNIHNSFQPFASTNFNTVSGENLRGPEFAFDAIELLNSSAQQSDYRVVFRDWFALLNHGYRLTAVGSSDSHDVSRYIVGQSRTYIACPDSDASRLDVETACSNLLAGRALVSMGLLVQVTVNGTSGVGDLATNLPEHIRVQARVLGPAWTRATNLTLFANGTIIREQELDPNRADAVGIKAVMDWTIPRPTQDVFLVAVTTGPGVTAPFWAIPKPYQPTSSRWAGRLIAATNPVWLDCDGDGRFTAARGYARKLLAEHGTNPQRLLRALARFDEATAVQVASLCAAAGADIRSDSFRRALDNSAEPSRRGFELFITTLK